MHGHTYSLPLEQHAPFPGKSVPRANLLSCINIPSRQIQDTSFSLSSFCVDPRWFFAMSNEPRRQGSVATRRRQSSSFTTTKLDSLSLSLSPSLSHSNTIHRSNTGPFQGRVFAKANPVAHLHTKKCPARADRPSLSSVFCRSRSLFDKRLALLSARLLQCGTARDVSPHSLPWGRWVLPSHCCWSSSLPLSVFFASVVVGPSSSRVRSGETLS